MSTVSNTLNTGSQATFNTDTSKIFLFENRYETNNYINNSGYNPVTLLAGTVMARVAGTNILIPFSSKGSNGSQFPIGILADDYVVAAGTTVKASICIYGDVNINSVILAEQGDTLNTVVSNRTVRDKIKSESAGIRLIDSTEMTAFDN